MSTTTRTPDSRTPAKRTSAKRAPARRPTDRTRTSGRGVTSITEIRAAVKQREDKVNATNRLVTTLLLVMAALIVIGMAATIRPTVPRARPAN